MDAEPQDAGSRAAAPHDANDFRRVDSDRYREYRRSEMRKPLPWIGGAGIAVVVGFIASAVSLWVALIAGLAAWPLAVMAIVSFKAGKRASADFFRAYADARGLVWSSRLGTLPALTSLLKEGNDRRTDWTFTGKLPKGPDGVLAYYSYVRGGMRYSKDATQYDYIVVLCQLPEASTVVKKLAVSYDHGFRESIKHHFGEHQRVELESVEFDENYEALIGDQDDMNMALQIFEPTFIVWLTESGFSFELNSGALCVAADITVNAENLDDLCAAAGVIAKRLTDEAEETASVTAANPGS